MAERSVQVEILPGDGGNVGIITLNKLRVLNALNEAMIAFIQQTLLTWRDDKKIKAVIIKSAPGRAFSSGGDIREIHGKRNNATQLNYFKIEYQLNYLVHTYPKPYIALLDGLTMGGGAGIAIPGAYRIATEQFFYGMPETSIGFHPDVGSSYLFARLPHQVGYYLALTGERVSYQDAYDLGIVDYIVTASDFPNIVSALQALPFNNDPKAQIDKVLQPFLLAKQKTGFMANYSSIATCFGKNTVEDILKALQYFPNPWCQQVAAILLSRSPLSLKVTLKQVQLAKRQNFARCLQIDYNLAKHFLAGHDFYEGVRAAVIDKDKQPVWLPAKLSEVTDKMVCDYFKTIKPQLVLSEMKQSC